jgi:fatty-acyl-CoA synthase
MFTPPVFPAIPDPFRFWRGQAPHRTALIDRSRGQRFTYAEMDAGADRWAGLLRDAGVKAGDVVAVLAGNRREVVEAFHACGRVGAALLPLNWRLSAPELAPIVADARPALVVGEERFRALGEAAMGPDGPRWIDVDHDAPALLGRASIAPDVPRGPEDAALILYTSGSTGKPKGAVLPHRQIHWNAVATTTGWELGHADVAPVSTPFFHTGGWNVFATPLWQRGGTIVLFDGFDADAFLDGLAEERCTVAMVVPTQLVMLAERASWGRALPDLRFLISGGAPCPSSLAARTRAAGYRFREGFGLTECGPNCFAISDEDAIERGGSVGRPMPFLQMRLDAGDGRPADAGEAGELLLRGPQMFAGYLRDPGRTAEVVTEDGWLRTGDLARRDADGFYTICGRRKEMYISGGENVFPGEVEAVLADCPGVAEAVVVGVPDERWGEVGRAYVVPRAGQTLTDAAVLEHARSRLAKYKVPRYLAVVTEIPRLGSGKPDRRALATVETPR